MMNKPILVVTITFVSFVGFDFNHIKSNEKFTIYIFFLIYTKNKQLLNKNIG